MARIAYLVLAHREPGQCVRLIRNLVSTSSRVFLHVDARVAWAPFAIDHPHVARLTRRHAVTRGGWSQTQAMMTTLRTAFQQSDCDYFVVLAATDFPIKPRQEIEACLADRYPLNFINYFPLLEGTSGVTNLTQYHFVDQSRRLARLLGRDAPDDRSVRFASWVAFLNNSLPARAFPAGLVPFRGSTRWCLNRETVRHLLEAWDSPAGRQCRRYFRYTWGSDEMFFQTVIFNSKWAEQCHLYEADTVRDIVAGRRAAWPDEIKAYWHYIDWDPSREDPAILDLRDFERLKKSPALFACKFLSERSAAVLDALENGILAR